MSRHEAPEVGDAVVRMLRGLVTRAAEGDTEALEQLARIEQLAPIATSTAVHLMQSSGRETYSFTFLAGVLGTSRQAARKRAVSVASTDWRGVAHVLLPGHNKRECRACKAA